jgi:NAD+ synthetase
VEAQMNYIMQFSIFFILMLLSNSSFSNVKTSDKSLKVAMIQMNSAVGDVNAAVQNIIEEFDKAEQLGADIAILPEGVLPGYPAWDLYNQSNFIESADQAVDYLREFTRNKKTALLIGHITYNPEPQGKKLVNAATLLVDGKIVFQQTKMLLPTYNEFDDARYFEPTQNKKIFNFRGFRLGIAICEDWWFKDRHENRLIYQKDPIDFFRKNKIDLGISISASPFKADKIAYRQRVHKEALEGVDAPLIWVNKVGAVDELVFDGSSFILDKSGNLITRLESFKPDFEVVEFLKSEKKSSPVVSRLLAKPNRITKNVDDEYINILNGISLGLREYMKHTGSKKVIFGLSGGLDSSIVAAIATRAIGPANVIVIMMPSKYSSTGSIDDSLVLAHNLGIPDENILRVSIKDPYTSLVKTLSEALPSDLLKGFEIKDAGIPYQNTQARLRMIIEYFVSNVVKGSLKLHTGDLSELLMGYTTYGGDDRGGYGVLHSLFKTEVLSLGYLINKLAGQDLIPKTILEKPPSAELAPGQMTENELVSYNVLDSLLRDYLEKNISAEILKKTYTLQLPHNGNDWVDKILKRIQLARWKINQGPPGPMVKRNVSRLLLRIPSSAKQFISFSPDNLIEPKKDFFCEEIFINKTY